MSEIRQRASWLGYIERLPFMQALDTPNPVSLRALNVLESKLLSAPVAQLDRASAF